MTEQVHTILPRVYTLGFRAGQAAQHFFNTLREDGDTFGLSNRLWFKIQEGAPEVWELITNFPLWYSTWWMDLLRNDLIQSIVRRVTSHISKCENFQVEENKKKDNNTWGQPEK